MWNLVLVMTVWSAGAGGALLPPRQFIYNDTYLYDVIYNVTVDSNTDQILDFQEWNETQWADPTRVHVWAPPDLTEDHPLFVTATQQRGVSSWELPLVVRGGGGGGREVALFRDMSRTLCPYSLHQRLTHPQEVRAEGRPRIQLSTWSPRPLTASIKLKRVPEFYLAGGRETVARAAPGAPNFYYYEFEPAAPPSVLLHVQSDDDLCAIVSVQNATCPMLDDESEVQYRGLRLTATRQAAVTVQRSMFPAGFFVVLIVKERDDACLPTRPAAPPTDPAATRNRLKHFRLSVRATLPYRRYWVVGVLTLGLVLAFCGAVELVALCRLPRHLRRAADGDHLVPDAPVGDGDGDGDADAESVGSAADLGDVAAGGRVTVAALCRAPREVRARRSRLYAWQALTVAVVYALPVLQLLAAYQRAALAQGDLDLCYYNGLCAHPLGAALADFNHVYSNVGYVVLGGAFVLQVRRRAAAERRAPDDGLGVPQHHGLLYSLGVALLTEGVLSAAYHLCPNQMNFQFDSSFMYVTAALCALTLYHARQPDAAARAHAAFLAIAALFALGVVGTLAPTDAFWAALTLLHVGVCAALSLHLYYFGGVGAGVTRLASAVRAEGVRGVRPRRAVRLALLAAGNVANWALAGCGWAFHRHELAKHLMLVAVSNAAMYTCLYVCCKLARGERVGARAAAFGAAALAFWAAAFYCFSRSTTRWALPPARSRELNAECSWLGWYDTHDAWHLASAAAMFLSFNLLLSIDDAQRRLPRHTLTVF